MGSGHLHEKVFDYAVSIKAKANKNTFIVDYIYVSHVHVEVELSSWSVCLSVAIIWASLIKIFLIHHIFISVRTLTTKLNPSLLSADS